MKREKELTVPSFRALIPMAHHYAVDLGYDEDKIHELIFYTIQDPKVAIPLLKQSPFAYFLLSSKLKDDPTILVYSVSEMGEIVVTPEERMVHFSKNSNYCHNAACTMSQLGDEWNTFYRYLQLIGTRGTRSQLMRLVDSSLKYYELKHTLPVATPLPPPTIGEFITNHTRKMRKPVKHFNEGNPHSSLH